MTSIVVRCVATEHPCPNRDVMASCSHKMFVDAHLPEVEVLGFSHGNYISLTLRVRLDNITFATLL